MNQPTVSIEIEKGAELVRQYVDGDQAAIVSEGVRKGLDLALSFVLGNIQEDRFTGKGPFDVSMNQLGEVTGRLRKSLTKSEAEITDSKMIAVEGRISSPVKYFAAHEFGVSGEETVKEHKRKLRGKSGDDPEKDFMTIASYTRQRNTPERKPLRTGLEEEKNQQIFEEEIVKGITDALTV
jgi:hypothetical protein